MIDYVDKVLKGWEWSLLIYKWLLSLCKWYLGYRSNKYDLVHRLNNGFLQLSVGVKNDLCYKLVHKIISILIGHQCIRRNRIVIFS